ncbi:MAG: hypothetical protein K0Q59_2849 [Paenibacillus sp.]|nr:hypothetical protein [Paenibacillus sp.]
MKTVMIVDDESMVRLGLQTVIDWQAHDFEIVGAYKNGLEAWNAINATSPDVLLTDIRMPEMDGLELIRRIRGSGSSMNIVILSSYEEFEYARQALQLHVQDYIVKHRLEADSLLDVLSKLDFSEANPTRSKTDRSAEHAAAARLLAATESGASFAPGESGVSLLKTLRPSSTASASAAPNVHWAVFEPLSEGAPLTAYQIKGLEIALTDKLQSLPAASAFVGVSGHRLHVLHWLEKPCSDTDAWLAQTGLAWEQLQSFARTNMNMSLAVGVGLAEPLRIETARAAAESLLSAAFYDGPGLYMGRSGEAASTFIRCDWSTAYKKLKPLVAAHDFEGVIQAIRHMQTVDTGQRLHPNDVKQLCGFCVNLLIDVALNQYPGESDRELWVGELQDIRLEELSSAASWSQAERVLRQAFERIREAIAESVRLNGWIGELKAYIARHYEQPLRLEDIAARVNFSVGYISQRFHQETGYSFSDYVTQVRIEQAIRLLRSGEWTTDDIAEKVGYPNANYFTKVFKKVTGLTLTEFKNSRLRSEGADRRTETGKRGVLPRG